ncbi:ZapG family protein [Lacimicrobium alkaliphilum]|uniref:DUF1043 family protein n=1 Tax=Lacimicrobium alkaliphilum TaxID=1526571 RepID=A0A0U2JID1_9ALTE|nr:DUF1043 family protein [Lacimicrobium alkaliphilum]ALS97398.1 hypothetical protein AT746_03320 [Lacimicrobium alkaliphilum]
MDWIIGILLLLCGTIVGFFVGRFVTQRQSGSSSGLHLEKEIKSMLSEQGHIHVNECRQVLEAMEQQSEQLKQQLDHYEALLAQTDDEDKESAQLSYFGDQASAYLRNQGKPRKQQNQAPDYQPRDYPSASSGLFSGKSGDSVSTGKAAEEHK